MGARAETDNSGVALDDDAVDRDARRILGPADVYGEVTVFGEVPPRAFPPLDAVRQSEVTVFGEVPPRAIVPLDAVRQSEVAVFLEVPPLVPMDALRTALPQRRRHRVGLHLDQFESDGEIGVPTERNIDPWY